MSKMVQEKACMKGFNHDACADRSAFERSKITPPSLPLPPGITFAQLPALLKPVPRKEGGWRRPPPAGVAKESGGVNGKSGGLPEDFPTAETTLRTQISNAKEKKGNGEAAEAKTHLGLHGALLRSEDCGYLWEDKTDDELALDLECCLADFDCLTRECDALFELCHVGDKVSSTDLKQITQALIDQLGSREEYTLHKIHMIYNLLDSTAAESGLNTVSFRGYVAAVLTQIQQELARRKNNEVREVCTDDEDVEAVLADMEHAVNNEDFNFVDAVSSWLEQVAEAITFGSWQESKAPCSEAKEATLQAESLRVPLEELSVAG